MTHRPQVKKLEKRLTILKKRLSVATDIGAASADLIIKKDKSQARFQRIRKVDAPDGAIGHYSIRLLVTAKTASIFIPLSIASGKKTSGFMYQIEGTGEAAVSRASVAVTGKGVTQVTLGTIIYAKVPAGVTAEFHLKMEIRGKVGKTYGLTIYRINYKRAVTESRYQTYERAIISDSLRFR